MTIVAFFSQNASPDLQNEWQKRLQFSTNTSESIKKSDLIFICVGTPTNTKSNEAAQHADGDHVFFENFTYC